jgi:hypothetical protein
MCAFESDRIGFWRCNTGPRETRSAVLAIVLSLSKVARASGGMADAHGSGPCVREDVRVQLPPRPLYDEPPPGMFPGGGFFVCAPKLPCSKPSRTLRGGRGGGRGSTCGSREEVRYGLDAFFSSATRKEGAEGAVPAR